MSNEETVTTNLIKINESDLFMKYKASYTSAFLDFSMHSILFSSLFYLTWLLRNSWLSCFTIPIMAFFTLRTFIIFHDCCHQSYTPNKTLNYIISIITGTFMLISPNWILDHHTHHLTNGNIENTHHYFFNETIILTKNQFLSKTKTQQLIHKIYKNPLVFFLIIPNIYFGIFQQFIYIVKKYRHPRVFTPSLLEITMNHIINNILSFLYLSKIYEYGLLWHFAIWFSMTASMSFMMFHNQHSFNPPFVVDNKEWTQRDSGLKGSSFFQISSYFKYFYMGIEYHHIHHMYSKLPGYNLQKYHEEIVSNSNIFDNIVKLSVTDCYNNLWLTLYDDDKHKYITFEEAYEDDKNK
jgi:omega-6 fatty acid desaturase (delta-12 desaturase)